MKANIYQISYDARTRAQLDPGFIALDIVGNPRADWREYWAIREFFLNNTLEEDQLYGFLSPSFRNKTNLSADQVQAFIAANPGREVYTFSPFMQDETCYLNMFEHGNLYHPGIVEIMDAYLKEIDLQVDLETLVMDFRSMIFCNYIVAKPSFWKTWFALNEKLFEIAEHGKTDLSRQLTTLTSYRLPVEMKVFISERIASLVLAMCPDITTAYYDPLAMPWSDPGYRPYVEQMMLLNRIKHEYLKAPDPALLTQFYTMRGAVLTARAGVSMERTKSGFIRTSDAKQPHLLYVCVADGDIPFSLPSTISPLMAGHAKREGAATVSDLAPEWNGMHEALGALAGCFALNTYIRQRGVQVRRVGVCSPRALISNQRVAVAQASADGDVLSVEMARLLALGPVMEPGSRDFLIAAFSDVDAMGPRGSLFDAFQRTHGIESLLRFAAMAVEVGALKRHDVASFINEPRFSPSSVTCGVFETHFWLGAVAAIEDTVRACLARYGSGADNVRVWAHCGELFGSFLLLKHLEARYPTGDIEQNFAGRLNRIRIASESETQSLACIESGS